MSDVSLQNTPSASNSLREFLVPADSGEPLPFFRDDENQLLTILDQPQLDVLSEFSPIVLHGHSGIGKTAIARNLICELCRADSICESDILILSGADFCRSYALAVETNSVNDWRSRFEPAQVVLIDGLQQMAGKSEAQHELRCLIDQSLLLRKVLVFTSLEPVECLGQFESSLISRLIGGLSIPLTIPGESARKSYLDLVFRSLGCLVDADALQKLADEFPVAWPALNGIAIEITRTLNNSSKSARQIDLNCVIAHLSGRTQQRPDLRTITGKVARYFDIRIADMKGQSRKQAIVHARAVAIYLARSLSDVSLESIGKFLGNRDHTTVLHAFRKIEKLLLTDQQLQTAMVELKSEINQ